MRIVCMSDTHKKHKDVVVPVGDVLVFAGDMCGGGSEKSARKFGKWFASHPHKHKVIVAGNHDRCFERSCRLPIKSYYRELGITYLEHEPINIEGLKFFGSPFSPRFGDWSFYLNRGEELERKWSQIPDDTEVLITHGPPRGILDLCNKDESCGCEDLMDRITCLKKLKAHIFGHIHFSQGTDDFLGIKFVNAAICGENYNPDNSPIVIDI